ncbi:MAG: acyl carrier protein [Myxococcales bacterium]|nr:acyl carrier protein [Myxococcales bacterium]
MTTVERVRAFIVDNFYVEDGQVPPDEASLLELGVVDSTGVLEVIAFLQDELGVKVEDREILPENLDSIANIAAFVARKRADAA